jgi:hypothetical protein
MNEITLQVHYMYLLSEYRTVKDVQMTSYGAMQSSLQMRGNSLWQQIEDMRLYYPSITEEIDNTFCKPNEPTK